MHVNELRTLVPAYKPHPKFGTFFSLKKSAAYTQVNTADLVHLMNHNVVHIYHNYKDFNSFSVLSPENEISDTFISFYFTEVFPNKKNGHFDRQC